MLPERERIWMILIFFFYLILLENKVCLIVLCSFARLDVNLTPLKLSMIPAPSSLAQCCVIQFKKIKLSYYILNSNKTASSLVQCSKLRGRQEDVLIDIFVAEVLLS